MRSGHRFRLQKTIAAQRRLLPADSSDLFHGPRHEALMIFYVDFARVLLEQAVLYTGRSGVAEQHEHFMHAASDVGSSARSPYTYIAGMHSFFFMTTPAFSLRRGTLRFS